MDHPSFVEQTNSEHVFSLLGDHNRIDIIRTLWEEDDAMPFSELYESVDIRDSGQFNYHLDKLLGQFVTKTENGGYGLTEAGRQINGAIEAGAYTTSGGVDAIPLEQDCGICGGVRTVSYRDERITVGCDSCDAVSVFAVPPSVFAGYDREEIPLIAGQYLRVSSIRINSGFCSYCYGPVERTVCPVSESVVFDGPKDMETMEFDATAYPIVQYECRQCGTKPTNALSVALLDHPAVVSFYNNHNIDIRAQPIWEFSPPRAEDQEIRSKDPFRASYTFGVNSEELTVVVDESLSVVETK